MARWAKKRLPKIQAFLGGAFGTVYLPRRDATLGGLYLYQPTLVGTPFAGEFRVYTNGSLLLFASTVPGSTGVSQAEPQVVGNRIHTDDRLAAGILARQIKALEDLAGSSNPAVFTPARRELEWVKAQVARIQGWDYS